MFTFTQSCLTEADGHKLIIVFKLDCRIQEQLPIDLHSGFSMESDRPKIGGLEVLILFEEVHRVATIFEDAVLSSSDEGRHCVCARE